MSTSNRIYLYKRYERFWHWSQAALVIFMLITGFEIHGTYEYFGFQRAADRQHPRMGLPLAGHVRVPQSDLPAHRDRAAW